MGMSVAAPGKKKIIAEINITPLTDIFLVLLIIMMIVAPTLASNNQEIKAPQLAAGTALDPNRLTVEVTADGTYFVDGEQTAPEALVDAMRKKAPLLEEKDVIIRADKQVRSKSVMKIFDAARDAEYKRVVVAGEALKADRQQQLQQQSQGPMLPNENQGAQ